MLKFVGVVILMACTFAIGYYVGQRPAGEPQKVVQELSRTVMDTARGIERDLRRRQGLIDAKARVIQAKSDMFDKNFGDAAKELAEAVDSLENTSKGSRQQDSSVSVKDLAGKIRELRLEVSMGKKVPLSQLDGIQKDIDKLLNQ